MLFQNQIMDRGVEIIVSEVITVFMVYLFYSFVYLIFPRTLFFREILGLQQNRGRYRDFSYTPAWNTWISSPGSTLPTRIGHFFLPRMNFTLTHNNHPYSIMYLRAHSWCYISCGFGQKYNISIIITSYKYFHCPKKSSVAYTHPYSYTWKPLMFLYCLYSFAFSNESVLHIRWPKYWSFSLSIRPSNEY